MPSSGSRKQRYYCDYCDSFLTHDSRSVRREHDSGYKHKSNVKAYYLMYSEEGQAALDAEARGLPPPVFMNPPVGGGPGEGNRGGMPPGGMPPRGMPTGGMPPGGMPPRGMPPGGMPPRGMPPGGMPPGGMPPGGPLGYHHGGPPPAARHGGPPPPGRRY